MKYNLSITFIFILLLFFFVAVLTVEDDKELDPKKLAEIAAAFKENLKKDSTQPQDKILQGLMGEFFEKMASHSQLFSDDAKVKTEDDTSTSKTEL